MRVRIRCINLLYDLLFVFKLETFNSQIVDAFRFLRLMKMAIKRSDKTQNTNNSDNKGGCSELDNGNSCTDGKENTANNAKNGRQRFEISHIDKCPHSNNCPCGYGGEPNTQPNCGHMGFELFYCIDTFFLWLLIGIIFGIGLNIYYLSLLSGYR